ncbi:MAG: DUF1015 domain-containing protein [bacterium]|nr:DUF1015 domain-containing protein [bacterium]
MAEIRAFRGIRYSGRDGASLSSVLAPPYDVIDSDQQRGLCDSDPYNVVRLILDQDRPGDGDTDNRYTRAAGYFQRWQEEGVLSRDEQPTLYLYEQEYALPGGERRIRRGIIGALRLVDFSRGIVLPHEQTFSKHKEDRLRLMNACGANFSPVFGLYSEPEGRIAEVFARGTAGKSLAVADLGTETHRMWALTDPDMQAVVISAMADKQLFIADGHHRYETALNYSREQRRLRGLGEEGNYDFDYVMMVMVEMSDPGLTILPTHRLVLNGELPSREKLESFFDVRQICGCCHGNALSDLAEAGKTGPSFILHTRDAGMQLLTLRSEIAASGRVGNITGPRAGLDVTILHELLLRDLMGVDDTDPGTISFVVEADKALEAVRNGEAAIAVLLNPTRVEQVSEVALAGERMPRKSTYFYPKLITGLVINKLL